MNSGTISLDNPLFTCGDILVQKTIEIDVRCIYTFYERVASNLKQMSLQQCLLLKAVSFLSFVLFNANHDKLLER